jgi:hypothetical protein
MHLILTGATGAVGSCVLLHALASPTIKKLSILSRRPITYITPATDPTSKANVIVHKDYLDYPPEVLDQLKGANACIWAQGLTGFRAVDEFVSHCLASLSIILTRLAENISG